MKRLLKLAAAGALLVMAASPVVAGGTLTNAELRKLFPGTFAAVVHGSLQVTFTAKDNGVLIGQMPGKRDSGRWSLQNGQLCIMLSNWTQGQAACSSLVADNGWYRGQGVKFRKI